MEIQTQANDIDVYKMWYKKNNPLIEELEDNDIPNPGFVIEKKEDDIICLLYMNPYSFRQGEK